MDQTESSAIVAAAFALALLASLLLGTAVIESDRPFLQTETALGGISGERVPARLWQDPFAAVDLYEKKRRLAVRNSNVDAILDQAASGAPTVTPLEWESPADGADTRSGRVLSAIGAAIDTYLKRTGPEGESYEEPPTALLRRDGRLAEPRDLETLGREIANHAGESDSGRTGGGGPPRVTVLGVNLFGEPYAGNREKRIRTRYAVLSALGEMGLGPESGQRIGYARWTFDKGRNTRGEEHTHIETVPYEWFVPDETGGDPVHENPVLVLWLREEAFEREPQKKAAALIRALCPNPRISDTEWSLNCVYGKAPSVDVEIKVNIAFRMLAPAGSGVLRAAMKSAETNRCYPESECDSNDSLDVLCALRVYSASSTVPLSALVDDTHREYDGYGVAFDRVAFTNDALMRAVHDELCRRGVRTGRPGCEASTAGWRCWRQLALLEDFDPGDCIPEAREWLARHRDNQDDERRDHVVLISEWDTLFGRNMREEFRRAGADHCSPASGEGRRSDKRIHSFSYLRGLDGTLPGQRKVAPGAAASGAASAADVPSITDDRWEAAVGDDQLDYLQRLAGQIVDLNRKLRSKRQERIAAIGILGSDVYDKLLILKSLRERFDDVLFFTTDLDARYLDPRNRRWTRNLLVTSTFDLALDPALQMQTPPFRDSYQTGNFLATRMAIRGDVELARRNTCIAPGHDWHEIHPLVFEIGRTEAFALETDEPWTCEKDALFLRVGHNGASISDPRSPPKPTRDSPGNTAHMDSDANAPPFRLHPPQAQSAYNAPMLLVMPSVTLGFAVLLSTFVFPRKFRIALEILGGIGVGVGLWLVFSGDPPLATVVGIAASTLILVSTLIWATDKLKLWRNRAGLVRVLHWLAGPLKPVRELPGVVALLVGLSLIASSPLLIADLVAALVGVAALLAMVAPPLGKRLSMSTNQFLRQYRGKVIATLGIATVIVGLSLVFLERLPEGRFLEPFRWTEGISIWPTQLLRLLIGVLILYLIVYAGYRIRRRQHDVEEVFYRLKNERRVIERGRREVRQGKNRKDERFDTLFANLETHFEANGSEANTIIERIRRRTWNEEKLDAWIASNAPTFDGSTFVDTYGDWRKLSRSDSDDWYLDERDDVWKSETSGNAIAYALEPDRLCRSKFSGKTFTEAYGKYLVEARWQRRLMRAALGVLGYWVLAAVLIWTAGGEIRPVRGLTAAWTDFFTESLVGGVLFLFLLFLVLDAARLNFKLLNVVRQRADATVDFRKDHAWDNLQIVAKLTEPLNTILIFPFIALFLLLASKLTLFDNWQYSIAHKVLILVTLLMLLGTAAVTRRRAEKVRRTVLKRIDRRERKVVKETEEQQSDDIRPLSYERAKELRRKVNELSEGAFQSWWHQPIIQSLIWLLASLSIVGVDRFLD